AASRRGWSGSGTFYSFGCSRIIVSGAGSRNGNRWSGLGRCRSVDLGRLGPGLVSCRSDVTFDVGLTRLLLRQIGHDLFVMQGLAYFVSPQLALYLAAYIRQAALDPPQVQASHAHRTSQARRTKRQQGDDCRRHHVLKTDIERGPSVLVGCGFRFLLGLDIQRFALLVFHGGLVVIIHLLAKALDGLADVRADAFQSLGAE